jgi:hypothetical protein
MSEKDKKKEMTINDLSRMMTDGFEKLSGLMDEKFEKSNKMTDEKIEAFAILVQNQFMEIKSDIKELKDEVKEVKSDTEDIKADLNKKVDKITHNDLTYRVEKLEEKFA